MSSDGQVRSPTTGPPIPMPAGPAATPAAVPASRAPTVSSGRLSEASRVAAAMRVADRDPDGGGGLAQVGPSITIKGDLAGEEDALIEGRVEGRIEIPAHHLTIGVQGM